MSLVIRSDFGAGGKRCFVQQARHLQPNGATNFRHQHIFHQGAYSSLVADYKILNFLLNQFFQNEIHGLVAVSYLHFKYA